MVGLAENVQGLFIDRIGKKLNDGGGTLVLEGNEKWNGVRHDSTCTFNDKDFMFFHAYDAKEKGLPKLKIAELTCDEEFWPIIKNTNILIY